MHSVPPIHVLVLVDVALSQQLVHADHSDHSPMVSKGGGTKLIFIPLKGYKGAGFGVNNKYRFEKYTT